MAIVQINIMKTPLTFLLSLTFLFLFSGSSVVFGDYFEDILNATNAYERQDYKTAHRLWLSLAEQGDASAQYNLGQMYVQGKGVPQDYKEAVKWFRLSAEQGDADAQNNLGNALRDLMRIQDSIDVFERVLRQGTAHIPTLHINLARSYIAAGDTIRARGSYSTALKLDPSNSVARRELDALRPKSPSSGLDRS